MKDDSGSYAVFIEQGSSASQLRAKVLDCAGQASDRSISFRPSQSGGRS